MRGRAYHSINRNTAISHIQEIKPGKKDQVEREKTEGNPGTTQGGRPLRKTNTIQVL